MKSQIATAEGHRSGGPSPASGKEGQAPPKSIRVLLADDHALVRAGVRLLVERIRGVSEVVEARDGREALALCAARRPHIALLETSLAGLNGFEVAARIARKLPATRVVMFSRHSSEESVARALRSGAAGFLVKDAGPHELDVAVDAVLRGGAYLSPSVSKAVIERYLNLGRGKRGKVELLTARQREILQLVAEGHSSKECARLLGVSVKTVETHRAHIMRRLNIGDLAGLVRYAVRTGVVTA
jgi:DNA-binding NarL/FixJ family response regulator